MINIAYYRLAKNRMAAADHLLRQLDEFEEVNTESPNFDARLYAIYDELMTFNISGSNKAQWDSLIHRLELWCAEFGFPTRRKPSKFGYILLALAFLLLIVLSVAEIQDWIEKQPDCQLRNLNYSTSQHKCV